METETQLRNLRREVKTAVELAVVAMAPFELLNRLAAVAGLLDALVGLPTNCAPAVALAPKSLKRATVCLADWRKWEQKNLRKAYA